MLQYRQNAFETNSSSVHSFYIKKDFVPERFKETHVVSAYFDEYGWGSGKYSNRDFLSYVWTALVYTNATDTYIPRVEKLLEEYNIKVIWQPTDSSRDTGYVDHGWEFLPILTELLEKPELFLSAILSNETAFFTNNDTSDDFSAEEVWDKKDGFIKYVKSN